MGRLFGTDGIRGAANVYLTPTLATDLGRAAGHLLEAAGGSVVVGQDTRRSGDMLVAAVTAGLTSVGADVLQLGVVTTPCLVQAASTGGHVAGVMVSASHNPADDNGLKVVSAGRKIDDALEEELERLILNPEALPRPRNADLGTVRFDPGPAVSAYRRHLLEIAGDTLRGLRIGLDCANGSASGIAPDLFDEMGAEVTIINASPDGTNINLDSGSTHPQGLATLVAERGLDMGFAFDGDADRLIAVDAAGGLVDGDAVMGICALRMLAAGTLRNATLVVTVLSNGGLDRAIRAAGGRVLRTPVGDRHVMEAMVREDASLGGEQSGHVIFRDRADAGDGMLTAIELVKAVRSAGGRTLAQLAADIPRLPQVMLNSAVRQKDSWEQDPVFASAVADAETRLGTRGRILVRPSGTEPKLRIMVEGDELGEITEIARELDELAKARLD
ncbi:MAG TPA: phosphoglucosamine mutase [Candidatus Limnocylindria bacterium]|nr:phosphoglucosamine mutase [Candidatus Limnocylindria bacterium]